jgi:gentisate 1,2-dioxygenase
VYHVIEGNISVHIVAERFKLSIADTCCAPGYTPVTLKNHSATEPAYIFMVDEAPLHRKLGVYEVR